MASSPPDLQAVPEPAEAKAPAPTGRTPWWGWLALAGFILCAAGWFTAQRGAAALEGELEASRAELAGVQTELRAHERHLEALKERSGLLAGSLQELAIEAQQLADEAARDPRAPVATEPSEKSP